MTSQFILGLIFLGLACTGVIFRKTYFEIPYSELKKRHQSEDNKSKELFATLTYGISLRGLLWLYLGLTLAIGLTLLARSLPIWASIILISLIIYLTFSWLPSTKVGRFDRRLTRLVSPATNWLLKYTSQYIKRLYIVAAKRYVQGSSEVFDNEDLMRFFKSQSRQPYNRIEAETLLNLERSLAFNKHRIKDIMIPAQKVKILKEDDVIGPILINEIHESGQDYVLVRAGSRGDISGLLAFKDLSIKSQGRVASVMAKTIYYLNENDTAYSVIKAFFDTKQNLFVVINEQQKFVGVISAEDTIRQLLGSLETITFDDYTDASAVANLLDQPPKYTQDR